MVWWLVVDCDDWIRRASGGGSATLVIIQDTSLALKGNVSRFYWTKTRIYILPGHEK